MLRPSETILNQPVSILLVMIVIVMISDAVLLIGLRERERGRMTRCLLPYQLS